MPVPDPRPLLAVPNVSEGRDAATLESIAAAFGTPAGATPGTTSGGGTLLDMHADPDHHRAVLTLATLPNTLPDAMFADAILAGAAAAIERIDVIHGEHPRGEHPHVGALDVMPLVYLHPGMRGTACALALLIADRISDELRVPVFLYGELAGGRTRAQLRTGGIDALRERMASGEQRPDFGPSTLHPTAGATLVAAREPLVAFNLELSPPATVADAQRIAALIREGGAEGLPGLRAIGVSLEAPVAPPTAPAALPAAPSAAPAAPAPAAPAPAAPPRAQVSMNVERPLELPLRAVIEAVRRHAEVAAGELVGLAPRAAFENFPDDLAMPALDPERQVIENALG